MINLLFGLFAVSFLAWWIIFGLAHTNKLPYKLMKYLGIAMILEIEEHRTEDYYG